MNGWIKISNVQRTEELAMGRIVVTNSDGRSVDNMENSTRYQLAVRDEQRRGAVRAKTRPINVFVNQKLAHEQRWNRVTIHKRPKI
jgi:hypothetical protein